MWADLIRVIADADGAIGPPTAAELVEDLTPSGSSDPTLNTWAAWAGEKLVAYARAHVRSLPTFDGLNHAYVQGGVHPAWQGHGLGSTVLQWAENRSLELARAAMPEVAPTYFTEAVDSATAANNLLMGAGYSEARYWFDMVNDLTGSFTVDARTSAITPELAEEVRLAHNDAFATHWGSGPVAAQEWQRRAASPAYRPDLSRIVVKDGRVLAYAVVTNAVDGHAYFDLIGVRGEAQGQGLGRAVLTSALAAIQATGEFTSAGLDVDADNPSGAGALYRKHGFSPAARKITWQKPCF